jgi:hypothetical protein
MTQPPPDGISTEGIEPFQPLTGGCLCGAVKYRISAAPLDAGYCHCRLCQKSSGAPTLAWLTVPIHGFAYTHGNPTRFHSSPPQSAGILWALRYSTGLSAIALSQNGGYYPRQPPQP